MCLLDDLGCGKHWLEEGSEDGNASGRLFLRALYFHYGQAEWSVSHLAGCLGVKTFVLVLSFLSFYHPHAGHYLARNSIRCSFQPLTTRISSLTLDISEST